MIATTTTTTTTTILSKGPWWKLYARLKGLNRDSGLWLNHYPFASDQFLSPLQWKTALNHRYYLNLEVIPNGIKCTCWSEWLFHGSQG